MVEISAAKTQELLITTHTHRCLCLHCRQLVGLQVKEKAFETSIELQLELRKVKEQVRLSIRNQGSEPRLRRLVWKVSEAL